LPKHKEIIRMRSAEVKRQTKETNIKIKINLDHSGKPQITSKIGFLNHMLETFAHHSLFEINADIKGDLHVDQHHLIEDTGITFGEAFKKALGNKRGIKRTGFFVYPMDEALAMVVVDISGRPFLKMDAKFKRKRVGDFDIDTLEDFFRGFVTSLCATLHLRVYYGRSDHHKIESIFKAFGKAMKDACAMEPRMRNRIPSTKGKI